MNAKLAKKIRRRIRHEFGHVKGEYEARVVRWLVCPPKVRSQWPVVAGPIFIGHAVPVMQLRLKPGCPRALYKRVKRAIGQT